MSDTTAYRFNELRYKLQNNQLVLSDLNVGDFYQLVTHIETKGQALTVLGSEYLRRTIVLLNQYMDDLEFDKNVFQRIDNDLNGIVYLNESNKICYDFFQITRFFLRYFEGMVEISVRGVKINVEILLKNIIFLVRNANLMGQNIVIMNQIKAMRKKYIKDRENKYCIPQKICSGMEKLFETMQDKEAYQSFEDFALTEYLDMMISNVTGLIGIFVEYKTDWRILSELFKRRNHKYFR